MKHILLITILYLAGSSPLSADTLDLFIMAGQSNMQGWRSNAARYPHDAGKLDQHIPFYYKAVDYATSQSWETLKPQKGHFPAGHFGPEITFARALYRAGYHPAIFKYSSGGSSLARDWKAPGQRGQYDDMVKHLQRAIKKLEAQGHQVIPRAFIWIQGESDAENKQLAQTYYWRLKKMLTHLRHSVLKQAQLPVILSVDEQHPWVQQYPQVVKAQQKLAREDKHITFFSLRGLEKSDHTHLTAKGTIQQGRRVYSALTQIKSPALARISHRKVK